MRKALLEFLIRFDSPFDQFLVAEEDNFTTEYFPLNLIYVFPYIFSYPPPLLLQIRPQVKIYKRKQESKKERKHALDQESKIREKTIKKKEGRKWKTQIRI